MKLLETWKQKFVPLVHKNDQTHSTKSLQLYLTLCDALAHQAPLSMKFSRQEYWSGLPFPRVER